MALRGLVLCLVMLLVASSTWTQNAAQSDCSTVRFGMSSCMDPFVGEYESPYDSPPSRLCCSSLSRVVQFSPQCLCTVLNISDTFLGITVDKTPALSLPSLCKLQIPPGSHCKVEGFNIVPARDVGKSGGSTVKVPFYWVFSLLAILSFVSMF